MEKPLDNKQLQYAQALEHLEKLLGVDEFPELAEVLMRAIHDPSDEAAKHVAYITYALLHQRAQEKDHQLNLKMLTESVLVEIMPEYEDLFLELSTKHTDALAAKEAEDVERGNELKEALGE